jgi:hypothetical protein
MRRPVGDDAKVDEDDLRVVSCTVDFFGYIEFMGVRVCAHAYTREKPGL